MREFPKKLHVDNKASFAQYYRDRVLCYLRRDLYEHILRSKEDEYFDLDRFNATHLIDLTITIELVNVVSTELMKLGWNCALSYGNTALFIYSGEKPKNCW